MTHNDQEALRVLETLILLEEWRGRERAGLAPYHGKTVDDLHFRFAAGDVAEYARIAARAVAAQPTNPAAVTQHCMALFATERDARLEPFLAPVAEILKTHVWSNVRDLEGGFYERLQAMTEAEILRGLPPIEEVATGAFADAPIVYLSCDFRYFALFARPLMRSLAANSQGAQIHVHIMNAPNDQVAGAICMADALGLRLALTREAVLPADQATPSLARAYFHAVRFVRFYQHLKAYGRTLWLMDVDGLFNRSPSEMFAQLGGADVAMRVRPGRWEPWNQFNACVVAATPTQSSMDYFRLVAAYIAHFRQAGSMQWGIDQLAMYGVYRYLGARARAPIVAALDARALDYEHVEAGILWCNSGAKKFAGSELLSCRDPESDRYPTLFARYST